MPLFEELQRAANRYGQQMKLLEQIRERLRTLVSYKPSEPDEAKLYEIAKDITLKAGYPYTDPRTLETTEPSPSKETLEDLLSMPVDEPIPEEGGITMATTKIIHRADLYYKSGSSDKVYHLWMEKTGPDYYTRYQYGRRGSTLRPGLLVGPANEPKAYAYYKKKLEEQLKQGYKPLPSTVISGSISVSPGLIKGPTGATGPVGATGVPIGVATGSGSVTMGPTPTTVFTEELLLPMLLNDTTEEILQSCIRSQGWCLQEKHDGRRMILNFKDGGLSCCNKKAKLIEPPQEYWKAIDEHFKGFDFVIDGEACGPIFWVFDLIWLEGSNQMGLPYEDRLENLGMLMRSAKLQKPYTIRLVGTATTTSGKRALFNEVKERNGEGVVVKDLSAFYVAGRPNSGGPALKYKFVATATCQVMKVNDKRSVQIAVDDEGGLIAAGNVTIPINHEIPKPGDLVEVQYLYAYKGGSLYQPVYLGKRDDTEIEQLNKLKFKKE
jgi:bifunctional non-homologous end joining protein LigD